MNRASGVRMVLRKAGHAMIVWMSTFALAQVNAGPKTFLDTSTKHDVAAARAFETMLPVLRHPRCMNCHSKGDFPRQGNDTHPHFMNVRRGPAGEGVAGVKCSACHQERNLDGPHLPPGAPDWRLPSPDKPMIWEGLTNRQLCELIKDPKQNGGHTIEQTVEHMESPLVQWGWKPGGGRDPVPMSQQDFMGAVKQWATNGAVCPER